MADAIAYLSSPGSISKMLTKIKSAAVPERFSQEWMNETLNMKGGTANSMIPFLKKMGFLDGAGLPTNRYKEYRNDKKSGGAIAAAMKQIYAPIFAKNENAHTLAKADLEGLIVEYTGKSTEDRSTELTVLTFENLKKLAKFDQLSSEPEKDDTKKNELEDFESSHESDGQARRAIHLGYTINIQLPATKDVEVFHAIFSSLKQHLMDKP